MELLNNFKDFIATERLFQPKDKLLLAVSGGLDSVVLCELCKQAGYDFAIAHCNFKLRGKESDRDEAFVKALAEQYSVEIFIKRFDTEAYAKTNKASIQVAARELRYGWFNELTGYNWLLTAHHSDDNIETLLMNFFKGTGIQGLRGIMPKQGKIRRPLLFAKKQDLAAFATSTGLSFVEDSSNLSDKYTRNYFRNQLIPGLQKVFPQVEDNLADNLQRFSEIELLYHQSIESHKKKLLEYKGKEVHIPVLKLMKTQPLATVIYEICKDYGFTPGQTGDLAALLKSGSGKYIASATHRIIRDRNWLIIAPNQTTEAEHILVEAGEQRLDFNGGRLSIEYTTNVKLQANHLIAQLDAAQIKYPLLLRRWRTGDYFYPLGMQKKKKLGRFFIDQKVSLSQKENVWVLEMDKKIAWVVGMRIDDRFKVTDVTKNVLQLEFLPSQ